MVFVCTYYSDLGKTYYGVRASFKQSKIAAGVKNYTVDEIVPKTIKSAIKIANSSCSLKITPRLLTIYDDLGGEWKFTIPFKPYSDTWELLLNELNRSAIKSYIIRGEKIQCHLLS